jgi:small GTP-binding protein
MLEVLDTAGQEEYTALREQWIRDGDGFVLIYSISSRSSFTRISKFYQQILRVRASDEEESKNALVSPVVCLVGNKSDRVTEREVSTQEGFAMSKELGCRFVEASAKNCVNVERAFYDVVRLMREQRKLSSICQHNSIKNAVQKLETHIPQSIDSRPGREGFLMLATSLFRGPKSRPLAAGSINVVQQAALNQTLGKAAKRDKRKTVKRLLLMGADPNGHAGADGSAFYAAVSMGHIKMVKLLLKNGAAVNAHGVYDSTALEAAAIEGMPCKPQPGLETSILPKSC